MAWLSVTLLHIKLKTTAAILTEEVCSQELQDTRLDYGESETGHAALVAACPVRLAKRTTALRL